MNDHSGEPKALFLSPDGNIYPDSMICSGVLPAKLNGKPCPFSQSGRIPDPLPLDSNDAGYSIDKGRPGDLCPPCVKQHLAHLGQWASHNQSQFPTELLLLRLWKRLQWFWMVVPGLNHADPMRISRNGNGAHPHE
jgi:hypothetical protein